MTIGNLDNKNPTQEGSSRTSAKRRSDGAVERMVTNTRSEYVSQRGPRNPVPTAQSPKIEFLRRSKTAREKTGKAKSHFNWYRAILHAFSL
jgi:hypothetical protein